MVTGEAIAGSIAVALSTRVEWVVELSPVSGTICRTRMRCSAPRAGVSTTGQVAPIERIADSVGTARNTTEHVPPAILTRATDASYKSDIEHAAASPLTRFSVSVETNCAEHWPVIALARRSVAAGVVIETQDAERLLRRCKLAAQTVKTAHVPLAERTRDAVATAVTNAAQEPMMSR